MYTCRYTTTVVHVYMHAHNIMYKMAVYCHKPCLLLKISTYNVYNVCVWYFLTVYLHIIYICSCCACTCVNVNYMHIICSSSEKGSEFKEAQGPKTSRPSDGSYRVPGLELTNKFSGLENN